MTLSVSSNFIYICVLFPLGSCWWCLLYFCIFPTWYSGSGVILDRTVSWSLLSFLLSFCNCLSFDLARGFVISLVPSKNVSLKRIFFLSSKPKFVNTQKNYLNERVFLTTQKSCKNWWIRKKQQQSYGEEICYTGTKHLLWWIYFIFWIKSYTGSLIYEI